MLGEHTKRIVHHALRDPTFRGGAVLTALGVAILAGGIQTWHAHHGALYVTLGGITWTAAGIVLCAIAMQRARKRS